MEVVVRTDVVEEVSGHLRYGIEVVSSLRFILRIALLRRATEHLVVLPVGFLAFTAAIPLVLAFAAALERYVCMILVAFGAGLPSGVHDRELVN